MQVGLILGFSKEVSAQIIVIFWTSSSLSVKDALYMKFCIVFIRLIPEYAWYLIIIRVSDKVHPIAPLRGHPGV